MWKVVQLCRHIKALLEAVQPWGKLQMACEGRLYIFFISQSCTANVQIGNGFYKSVKLSIVALIHIAICEKLCNFCRHIKSPFWDCTTLGQAPDGLWRSPLHIFYFTELYSKCTLGNGFYKSVKLSIVALIHIAICEKLCNFADT